MCIRDSLYYVKSWKESTRLEKNGRFLYESVPGTSVTDFSETEEGIHFFVSGEEDAEITVELSEGEEYRLQIDGVNAGEMRTNPVSYTHLDVYKRQEYMAGGVEE